MLRLCACIKLTVALMLTLVSSAYGQSPAASRDSQQKEVAVSESKPSNPDEIKPKDLHSEVESLKAENAAVREQLRKMEEQQKALLEQFERLQRRFEGTTTGTPQAADEALPVANAPVATNSENASAQPTATPQDQPKGGRYDDGILIWETSEDAAVPFQLKFTNTTQVRYLHTLSANDTFTDHLGVVR